MTVPFLASGARRRVASAIAALAVAAALAVGAAAPAHAAGTAAGDPGPRSAADSSPTPSPTVTPLSGVVTATLAPVSEGVVHTGDPLNAWVSLQNGTTGTLGETTVTLQLGTTPLTTRKALTTWLAGKTPATGLTSVGKATVAPVPSGATGQSLVIVSAENKVLKARKPGIYPLQAVSTTSEGEVFSPSVMIVPDATRAHAAVGVVVPITAPGLQTGLLTADQLTTLTAGGGDLTARLNAVDGTQAILAVDPAIPASIRALGSAAPSSARDWLRHLMSLPNTRFALQFGDADTAAQISANRSLMQPTSLQAYLDPANFATDQSEHATPPAAASGSPTPTPSPSGSAGVRLPALNDLLDIGPARSDVFWPVTGTASAATVTSLGRLGDTATPAETLVASSSTASPGTTVTAEARSAGREVLVYDDAISASLTTAAQDPSDATQGAALTAAAAQLQLAVASADGASLLTVVDRSRTLSESGLRAAILAVTTAPSVDAASLSDFDSSAAPTRSIKATVKDGAHVNAVTALGLGEQQLGRFASILADPTVLTGPERAQVLQLLGGGWLDDDTWTTALRDHATATRTTLSSVGILPVSTVNIAGTGATLRFWVRNDLPWPVRVTMTASTDDARFEVPPTIAVLATASSNTRVELPVRAKITNGDAALELQLHSHSGVGIGDVQKVRISMHADWELAGVVILGIIVVVLLVAGAARMVFSRRRRGRQDSARVAAIPDAASDEVLSVAVPPPPLDAKGDDV